MTSCPTNNQNTDNIHSVNSSFGGVGHRNDHNDDVDVELDPNNVAVNNNNGHSSHTHNDAVVMAAAASKLCISSFLLLSAARIKRFPLPNIRRERVSVHTIFAKVGERMFRRCYRMSLESFWRLHEILTPYYDAPLRARKRGTTPNGEITFSSRLSMSLRWFAGGDPLDILVVHGVSYSEVFRSVWLVVDAINHCKEITLSFPTDHSQQKAIAKGFRQKSSASFNCCVGCIDGMLIWINNMQAA